MNKYICKVCATIYDPDLGDEEDKIPPGTLFEALPDFWVCPVCGSPKDRFEILTQEKYHKIINKQI